MAEDLKVGIAGYGVVGQRRRSVIDAQDGLRVAAVCDRKLDGSGTFEDGVRYFGTYQDLLEEPLDVLFVCLTNDLAAEVTVAGLEHGCHVFCEKPPGRNLDDVARVIECETRHPGRVLKYGFNHRYHDSVQDALKAMQSGEFGKVINLRGVYGKSKIINFESDWRTQRAIAGGGILLDQGIHMVDLLRLFGGEFNEVHAIITNSYWKHDVEDNAYALLRSADGVVAMLHSTATEWRHQFRLEISLEDGMLILRGILSGSKSYGAETLTVARKSEGDDGDPLESTTRYNNDPSWALEVEEFTNAILDGGRIENGSSDDALRTMELVYRIYRADRDWARKYDLGANE